MTLNRLCRFLHRFKGAIKNPIEPFLHQGNEGFFRFCVIDLLERFPHTQGFHGLKIEISQYQLFLLGPLLVGQV